MKGRFATVHQGGFHMPVRQHIVEDAAVHFIVIYYQHGESNCVDERGGIGLQHDRVLLLPEGRREVESASLADFTVHPDSSTHHLDELGRDSQTQPGSSVLASSGGISLFEGRKYECQLLRRNAAAGI